MNALVQYNADTRRWDTNVRFNWIHHPLSDLFVVYTDGRERDTVNGDRSTRALTDGYTPDQFQIANAVISLTT